MNQVVCVDDDEDDEDDDDGGGEEVGDGEVSCCGTGDDNDVEERKVVMDEVGCCEVEVDKGEENGCSEEDDDGDDDKNDGGGSRSPACVGRPPNKNPPGRRVPIRVYASWHFVLLHCTDSEERRQISYSHSRAL